MVPEITSRRVITVYAVSNAVFTLATSIIWGVNTLFLLDAGLDIFEVMLVNAAFTGGQVIFEVPTGVVADTIGRKKSFLIGIATLLVSTLLYLGAYLYDWGIWIFVVASVLIGLGFTFYTGAVDAWMVDALDHSGYERPKERIFATGQIAFGIAMVVGVMGGGFLGQVDLAIPYMVRAGLLAACFVLIIPMMKEVGFTPRALRAADFGKETRKILDAGVRYGWKHPVIRPLMFASLVQGIFFIYVFYSWQPYLLDLLGRDLVWVSAAVTAGTSVMSIVGNVLVGPAMRTGQARRDETSVLAVCAGVMALCVIGGGIVGFSDPEPGLLPFLAVAALAMLLGLAFGILSPVRMAYLNAHIPSKQRATVLSLDSLFLDIGGAAGQPGLGYISRAASIPAGWLAGGTVALLGYPLYRLAGKAERESEAEAAKAVPGDDGQSA